MHSRLSSGRMTTREGYFPSCLASDACGPFVPKQTKMGLVAYDSSDDEASDEAQDTNVAPLSKPSTSQAQASKGIEEKGLWNQLNASISVKRNKKGAVQILAPSLDEIQDSSDEEQDSGQTSRKKCKGSNVGSGLLSILPPVRSSFSHPGSTLQLIPKSVKSEKEKGVQSSKVPNKKQTNEEEFSGTFFSLELEAPKTCLAINSSISVNLAPKVEKFAAEDGIDAKSAPRVSEEERLKRIVAARFGDEAPEDIQLVDVNVNDHLSQNKDYIKTISQEKEEPVAGESPNPTARRKHQITYLAFQAKQKELSLKNEWATNKINKNQTRAKYGF